ncbi:MAG: hypothetical protein II795_01150 [Firmicutes bacterium]|nr:hypothetical protein [Bacillota bacterium]
MMRRMRMKTVIALLCAVMLVSLMGCATVPIAKNDASEAASAETPQNTSAAVQADQVPEQGSDRESEEKMSISMIDQTESITEMDSLSLTIDNTPVEVIWEDNESIEALKELVTDGPLTVQMSMYSTFEQVGSLGTSLPRNDVQTVTEAGDIVLYSGNQIVVFYGSNSWAYTRLGRITDKTASEMKELLGSGDVTLTLSLD